MVLRNMKSRNLFHSVAILLSCLLIGSTAFSFSSMPGRATLGSQTNFIGFGPSMNTPTTELCAKCNQQSDELTDDKNGPSQARKLIIGTTAAVLATTAMVTFPEFSEAIDLASLSGGASDIATSTNAFFASIGETGFYQAFSLVFLSEIGDKTFFIAGLLAAKFSKVVSFVGSMGALAVMSVISVIIGQVFHVVPAGIADGIPLDDVAAVLAFTFFGFKTLKDALDLEEGASVMDEEFEEAEEEVEGFDAQTQATFVARVLSIFGLVFAAEFGDRSFLSTIALSAAQNPFSVASGAIAAHAVATGIAVSGGAVVAKYLSERVIGIIGGTLFLVFAVTTALGIF